MTRTAPLRSAAPSRLAAIGGQSPPPGRTSPPMTAGAAAGWRHLRLHSRRNRTAAILVRCLTWSRSWTATARRATRKRPTSSGCTRSWRPAADPYQRDLPLHVTASALIVHPPTARVLLRWHQRQQAWLQVGGHGDPGETDPLAIVRAGSGGGDRPARPSAVAGRRGQARRHRQRPARQGRTRRTSTRTSGSSWPPRPPTRSRPESAHAPLRWLSRPEAHDLTSEPNLRETLARLAPLLLQ